MIIIIKEKMPYRLCVLAFALTGCDAFGVAGVAVGRARTVVMHHAPEPHGDAATKADTDVSFAAEGAAKLLADEKEAAKAMWLAQRDLSPRVPVVDTDDSEEAKWALDEADKFEADFADLLVQQEEVVAIVNKDELAKAELANVATELGDLGLTLGKFAVHSAAAITLEGGKMVVGAAGNAVKNSVIETGEYIAGAPGRYVEHVKAEVQAAPGRAVEHVKSEVQAVPGKAARAVQARLHEMGESIRAAPGKAAEHVKAEVRAVPGKVFSRVTNGVERTAEAKKEQVKLRVRNAAMQRIDHLLNRKLE